MIENHIMSGLFHRQAGLLNEEVLYLPNRLFMPHQLVQCVTTGRHLDLMGCRLSEIRGSSIAFDKDQSLKGALGEFVERYAAATYSPTDFLTGSYRELAQQYRMLPLRYLRFYSDRQYRQLEKLNIHPLGMDDRIEWVLAFDSIRQCRIPLPAYCVYMPYFSSVPSPHDYLYGSTSTGIAAGASLQEAVKAGFCECAERHAFSRFWYEQEHIDYRQYTTPTILKYFGRNKKVATLFDNPFVRMKVFDLSPFAPLETIVVFLYFRYKDKDYQSLGCAARFNKIEAVIKAALEAYQGIEYAISLTEKKLLPDEPDLTQIDNFDKHFHFYNQYPELRAKSKILREAQDFERGEEKLFYQKPHLLCSGFSKEEFQKIQLPFLLFKDITPIDVSDIGYRVARVFVPGWSGLTGCHHWPLLGQDFNQKDRLFLQWPHPFP